MNTEVFERLIEQTRLRSNSKAEIIQLNRSEKAFIDEDKKSIEFAIIYKAYAYRTPYWHIV